MQRYQQYCSVARASEILADRWTPLIVRELVLGSHRFNEIERGLPGISRSLLSSRLRDLEDSGVVERLPRAQSMMTEYHQSEGGRELKAAIEALGAWVGRWAFGDPRPEELDAGLLVWKIHQRLNRELLPETRTVVEFDFTGPRGRSRHVTATGELPLRDEGANL
jgi:DNA-binding HxlR family transcriptional regulator